MHRYIPTLPTPKPTTAPVAVNHATCPDCTRCGGRLHCAHTCPNYRIFR